ncbi:hypothetical protein FNV43_RR01657 [Rhamnella rubrinervis]|uniref:Uncharacterized protein n=1 Tax=Rhamnella rubrinervis TaxID=2594499 RepID=A0A8K0HQV5_9ROSA|nr:hypothetical protein FNV43_RR01657 [Rhamnella rubrinervis]
MAAEIIGPIVLENLINLLVHEAKLLMGVKDQVSILQHDLGIMNAFLRDSAGKHKDSHIVKEVMNQTNKVALEAEDVIDEYIAMVLKQSRGNVFVNFFRCFGSATALHRLANKTTMINNVIRSINDNKASYNITEVEASFDAKAALWVHRRRRYVEETAVEGFAGKVDELDIEKNFKCRAWVYVSQEYNLRKLFLDILKWIIPKRKYKRTIEDLQNMYVEDLEAKLKEELSGKKYFIVMDDVWKSQVWEEVKVALPEEATGSRILITSRNKEVASRASKTHPYYLSGLNDDESWRLLQSKVFRGGQCPKDLEDCGLELAKVVKGYHFRLFKVNSFLIEDREPCLDILALSYNQLPYRLKSCFLYLGVFPEGFEISTTDLINLWISEGFIEQIGNRKVDAVAENYLEQLIDRSLIEVASKRSDGRVKNFRIHDLLRDFCVSQSVLEQFYEVHSDANNLSSRSTPARRLSVHCNKISEYTLSFASETLSARSVMFFSPSVDEKAWQRLFQSFKFVRVLFLFEVTTLIAGSSLKQIEKLFYLRYFVIKLKETHSASTTVYTDIPKSISKLRYLKKVDIRLGVSWPENIWTMTQLRHLSAYPMKLLPDPQTTDEKAGHDHQLNNLQVLSNLHVDRNTSGFIRKNKFPNLTKLGLFYDDENKEDHELMEISEMTDILESLEKLQHLQRLRITGFPQCERRRLKCFPSTLYKVTLYKTYVDWNLMKILGKLPNLRVLKIKDSSNPCPGKLIVLAGEFVELEVFKMDNYDIEEWKMEAQAMLKLQHLVIIGNRELKTLPAELWNLPT